MNTKYRNSHFYHLYKQGKLTNHKLAKLYRELDELHSQYFDALLAQLNTLKEVV